MKKLILTLIVLAFTCSAVIAQSVGINSNGSAPDGSAMLDVKSANKGLLIPNVALTGTTDVTTIATPAVSLLVYNTATAGTAPNIVTPGYYYNSGTSGSPLWTKFGAASGASQWTTTGCDIYYNTGNVGIGKATPTAQLDVVSSNTYGISSTGSTTGATGLYHIANSNAPTAWNLGVEGGAWASGAALGSLYIDKNGVGPKMTITPDGYVGIGTTTPGTKLHVDNGALYVHGTDNTANNYTLLLRNQNTDNMMVVYNDGTTYMKGNVGIGTTTPSVALDVNGSFKASGMPTIICPITTVAAANNFPFGTAETLTGNISSDASSITIGETGLYLISFALGFSNSSHGWITVNGAGRLVSWTNSDPDIFTTTTVAPLNSGDVIRLYLYSGTFSTDANRKFICVTKLH